MDLQPIKLEQPYSIIYPSGKSSDGHALKAWQRNPKITKQNLEDAWQAEKAFRSPNYRGGDDPSPMNAPEGDSNDYFLKAKNNIVGRQNDRKIGEFLNQFHGMDFFKRGVPVMEKGLKGTGYDMGPSANIVNNLEEAAEKGDTKEVENIIEEHPEESQEVLPEDTPIQKEAEQITEDTNKANDEVNNKVVEDFVKESAEDIPFKDIETKPYYDDWVNSEPGSEQFKNAYLSVVKDYGKKEADKQLEAWGIELPKEINEETGIDDFEAYARSVSAPYEAKERRQKENAQKRNYQMLLDNNNQQAWKDYALERDKLNRNGSVRKGWNAQVGKSILAEIMTPEEWANDSLRENVLRHTKFTRDQLTIRNNLKKSIAEEKKALGIDEETLKAKEEAKRQEEAKRKEEEKKRRDEAWAKLMATNSNTDKKDGGSIDWDKVHVYKPGEDPYNKVSDVYDWIDNPDYVHTDEPVMSQIHKDEDFAGPDELPATIEQIRDEDFVGPDEQLALYNGGVPAETEPVYDTSDYNFDWDYDIQTLGVKSPEEIPDAPVENVEQAKAKQRLMKWLKSHGRSYRMSEPDNDMSSREEIHNNYRGGGRAAGSSLLGNIGRASSLSYNAPNVHSLSKEDKHGGPSNSTASGSTELPNSEKPTERTMSMSTINSGETMFGKSGMLGRSDLNKGGEIKVGQSGIKADFTGHTSTPEELAPKPMGGSGSNGIYTDLIMQILRKFPNGYSDNQITITVNGQNVLVNGKQLNQLSDIEIQTLKGIL